MQHSLLFFNATRRCSQLFVCVVFVLLNLLTLAGQVGLLHGVRLGGIVDALLQVLALARAGSKDKAMWRRGGREGPGDTTLEQMQR